MKDRDYTDSYFGVFLILLTVVLMAVAVYNTPGKTQEVKPQITEQVQVDEDDEYYEGSMNPIGDFLEAWGEEDY